MIPVRDGGAANGGVRDHWRGIGGAAATHESGSPGERSLDDGWADDGAIYGAAMGTGGAREGSLSLLDRSTLTLSAQEPGAPSLRAEGIKL